MNLHRRAADSLHLAVADYDAICRQVVSHPSVEVCGLLGGVGGEVRRVYPVSNVAAAPAVSYYMDPLEQLSALKDIDRLSLDLVGVYHSHPVGPPTPSPTDISRALGRTLAYLILVPGADGVESFRAFRLLPRSFVEMRVIVGGSSIQQA